jgi:lactoylglutathione lyase
MALSNTKGIAHIGLFVKDIEVSRRFYCDILGFHVIFECSEPHPDGLVRIAFLELGDLRLEMIDVPGLTFPPEGCFQHIAIRVENIGEAKEKLEAFGVETDKLVHNPNMLWGGSRWVNFRGPDGEHLELNQVG